MVRTIVFVLGGALLCWMAAAMTGGLVSSAVYAVLQVGGLVGGGYYGWRLARKERAVDSVG
jgi:membrane associated rhomboid family serine protease